MKKTNYRKIYESYYGPIPSDNTGRTYDIHHIDGNHNNNDPLNLKAVTVQEHYTEHYKRKDWYACSLIAFRMNLLPAEISKLNSELQKRRVTEGTHHLLKRPDGTSLASDKVRNGTHHLLSGKIQSDANKLRVKNGTHNFLSSDFAKERSKKLLENGQHTSQIKVCCIKCSKEVSINTLNQHLLSNRCK